MKAAWIIDGYNLILSLEPDPDLAAGELARRRGILEDCLVTFGKQEGLRPVVVYDGERMSGGHPGGRRDEHLEVIFSDPPAIADDLIFERAARHLREGCKVQVVTSDGGLATSVQKAGAQVTGVEAFGAILVKLMVPPAGRTPGMTAMPDIEAHFMAAHRQEERRAAAAGVAPGRLQQPAVRPAVRAAASLAGAGFPGQAASAAVPAAAPAVEPAAEEERARRRENGRRRQQRRLQGRSDGKHRRRRH